MTKLDLVKRNFALHIVFLLCFFSTSFAIQDNRDNDDVEITEELLDEFDYKDNQTTNFDSISKDNSQLSPRRFSDLKDKYKGTDFIYERTKQNSGWWTRFKQSVSDFFRNLFNIKNAGQASKITDISIKIAGVIVFLLVLYFIFKAIVNKEGTWVFGKSSDKSIIPVTDLETNIHVADFNTLIKDAEVNNNYRLAIRYYYLWLLKGLSENQIIDYDAEKTNSDYQYEIKDPATSKKFAYTPYLYNYIWYGEFNVDQTQFDKAKHAFTNLLNQVKA